MSVKRVYFVRHGETEGNLNKSFQFPDTPLTAAGHTGAQAVAERFRHVRVDELIVSPFVRTQQTAEHINNVVQKPIVIFEAFHERMQPVSVRGKKFDSEEGAQYLKDYTALYTNRQVTQEGFENYYAVQARVTSCIALLEDSDKENIVVVTHGAFIRSVTSFLLLNKQTDIDRMMAIDTALHTMTNAGVTEFTYEDGVWNFLHGTTTHILLNN